MLKMFLIFTFILSLSSCGKKNVQMLRLDEVFEVKQEKYIVLFYSSTCYACINAIEILNKRYENKKYPGFCVEINTNNITICDKKVSNIGVNKIDSFKLYRVPYLVYIYDGTIEKELFGVKEIQKENLYIFFE